VTRGRLAIAGLGAVVLAALAIGIYFVAGGPPRRTSSERAEHARALFTEAHEERAGAVTAAQEGTGDPEQAMSNVAPSDEPRPPWMGEDLPPPEVPAVDAPVQPRPERPAMEAATLIERRTHGITLLDGTLARLRRELEAAPDEASARLLRVRIGRMTELRAARARELEALRNGEPR
jgi:hypothetical protein